MGQSLADALDVKEPPMTPEESARQCLGQIDRWTMDKSGKFLNYKGEETAW